MRLTDADELMKMIPAEEYNARMAITYAPTVDAEPTEEQVKEYCRKRCLVIVTSELFNEMKARWSAEPVKHGRWIGESQTKLEKLLFSQRVFKCSVCGNYLDFDGVNVGRGSANFCPNCGAMMDEVEEDA